MFLQRLQHVTVIFSALDFITVKNSHPVITLLGNNSGRNLGDAAILASILDSLTEELPKAEFLVPSTKPEFIDTHYGEKYKAKGINVLPWTGSIRLLGIPTFRALAKSDAALICDGIIFGYKLFSVHNFLITLIFLVPWAKFFNCKLVCFSCGIGPFPSKLSKIFAKYLINNCDLVIMRDRDSVKLAEEIGVTVPMQVTGDAAFMNKVVDESTADQIASKEGLDPEKPMLGLNITPYIDSWLEKSERLSSRSQFCELYSKGVNLATEQLRAKGIEAQPVIFSCSPMDEEFSHELAKSTKAAVIDNSKYLSHSIQGVMRKCRVFVGMRFHSLVLSSAVGVPVIGLVYAPKVRGYLRLLECEEFSLELAQLTPEILAERIVAAWEGAELLRKRQQKFVTELRDGAREAATQIRLRYFGSEDTAKSSAERQA